MTRGGASRLYYLCYEHPVLTQTFTAGEIGGLRDEGLRPTVVSCRRPRAGGAVDVEYLPPPFSPGVLRAAGRQGLLRPLASRMLLRRLSAARYRDEAGRCLLRGLVQFLWGCWLADQADRDPGGAHYHAQFLDAASTVAWCAAVLGGNTFSFTNHTAYNPYLPEEKLRQAAFALSISEYDGRALRRLVRGEKSTRILVAYQGIDTAWWAAARPPRDAGRPRVLSVGALREKKGHHVLLRSAGILRDRGRDLEVTIVGDGPERGRLEALRESLRLTDRVTFAGSEAPSAVRDRLGRADLFALACVRARNGDIDGIPVSLMEAMAAGVPVISTRISGVPELIEDAREGCLARPGDPGDLARMMEAMLDTPSRAAAMAERGREKVRRQHERRACVRRVASCLRDELR